MRSITAQLKTIQTSFPGYTFRRGEIFCWQPDVTTIIHPAIQNERDIWTLLHEIAHAELKHATFALDIYLIDQEVAAWEHARRELAPRFDITITDDHVQDHMDTYRSWLHQRSRCPDCTQNGIQITQNTYRCSNCRCLWRVNDARGGALRRVKLKP